MVGIQGWYNPSKQTESNTLQRMDNGLKEDIDIRGQSQPLKWGKDKGWSVWKGAKKY